MTFSGNSGSWTESLYLPDQFGAFGAIVTLATTIAQYRLLALTPDMTLDWARISAVGNPRDARPLILPFPSKGQYPGTVNSASGSPVTYLPGSNVTDNDLDSLEYRIDTAGPGGSYSYRWIHGIPDVQVAQSLIQNPLAIPASPATALASLPGALTWPQLMGQYLRVVWDNTLFLKRATNFAQTRFLIAGIDSLIVRGVAQRRVGRFFGQRAGRASIR